MDDTAQIDLGYLRKVTERGDHAPFLGGPHLIWWGSLATIAYLVHFAGASGRIGGGQIYLLVWAAFGIVGGIGQGFITRSLANRAGAGSAGNEASRVAWLGAVAAIVSYLIGAALASGDGVYWAFDGSVPVVFAAYALALAVSGWLTGSVPVKLGTAGALATVLVSTLFIGSTSLWLVAAAGAFVSMLLPGAATLGAYRRSHG